MERQVATPGLPGTAAAGADAAARRGVGEWAAPPQPPTAIILHHAAAHGLHQVCCLLQAPAGGPLCSQCQPGGHKGIVAVCVCVCVRTGVACMCMFVCMYPRSSAPPASTPQSASACGTDGCTEPMAACRLMCISMYLAMACVSGRFWVSFVGDAVLTGPFEQLIACWQQSLQYWCAQWPV